jgi:DNA-binding LacI/PurR family transcriptional regulator
LIVENITDPFYAELALGTEDKAAQPGYSVFIYNTGGSLKKEKDASIICKPEVWTVPFFPR